MALSEATKTAGGGEGGPREDLVWRNIWAATDALDYQTIQSNKRRSENTKRHGIARCAGNVFRGEEGSKASRRNHCQALREATYLGKGPTLELTVDDKFWTHVRRPSPASNNRL